MTNSTMSKISRVVVPSGGQATMQFTNIPQSYSDLVIYISGRYTGAESAQSMGFNMSINGVTTNRTYRVMQSFSGNTTESTTGTTAYIGVAGGTLSTAGIFNNARVYISNYKNSNTKSFLADFVSENNIANNYGTGFVTGSWSDNSAITSISIYPSGSNWAEFSTATLYGIVRAPLAAKATGGTIYQNTDYWYHVFNTSSTFTPSENLTCDYLVVAGGGGGAGWYGGGGGAGGLRSTLNSTGGGGSLESALSLSSGTAYTVTIGAGGSSQTIGGNSSFHNITSTGGGRGGSFQSNLPGGDGGSGGGGGAGNGSGVWLPGGNGTANQGFNGGSGNSSNAGAPGGGGAGGAAANAASTNGIGTDGGIGVYIPLFSIPTSTGAQGGYYAGGGGGGSTVSGGRGTYAGFGGRGGGGNGSVDAVTAQAITGTANTGGGGGGNGYSIGSGAAGGSGIVIVRYAK